MAEVCSELMQAAVPRMAPACVTGGIVIVGDMVAGVGEAPATSASGEPRGGAALSTALDLTAPGRRAARPPPRSSVAGRPARPKRPLPPSRLCSACLLFVACCPFSSPGVRRKAA